MYSHDRTIASAQVIDQLLPNLSTDERKLAKEPGMGGRIWFGQGLVFDEAYGILMTLGILTDPKQAGKESANTSGQLRLFFTDLQDAIQFAKQKGLSYTINSPTRILKKPKNYAANFTCSRIRGA